MEPAALDAKAPVARARVGLELDAVDPTGKELLRLMLKDESRHIAGTRLGVQTLMAHAGPFKTALLKLPSSERRGKPRRHLRHPRRWASGGIQVRRPQLDIG